MIILNLKNHVQFITEVEPPRNYKNISSLDKVAEYIFKNLSKYLPEQTS